MDRCNRHDVTSRINEHHQVHASRSLTMCRTRDGVREGPVVGRCRKGILLVAVWFVLLVVCNSQQTCPADAVCADVATFLNVFWAEHCAVCLLMIFWSFESATFCQWIWCRTQRFWVDAMSWMEYYYSINAIRWLTYWHILDDEQLRRVSHHDSYERRQVNIALFSFRIIMSTHFLSLIDSDLNRS